MTIAVDWDVKHQTKQKHGLVFKMAPSNQKAVEVAKLYFETQSHVAVKHMMHKKDNSGQTQVHLMVKRLQHTGSV